jgi:phosphoribosylformimino-5-aminoimidazole carboxamide ribotide isomerase
MTFTVLPAIDLRANRTVRLYQGDYTRQTEYPVEPSVLAQTYADAGARWSHVVDLDGARGGGFEHLSLIAALAQTGLKLQVGGGVRDEGDLARLFDAGVERVVLGSLAMREPARVCGWLDCYGPERLTIALDTRWRDGAWRLASAGWRRQEAATLDEAAPQYAAAGARHLLCTDIDRDGTLAGPNLGLCAHLRRIVPTLALQVSGGVRDLADVRSARASGAAGVVLGRALLERRFTLAEALAC